MLFAWVRQRNTCIYGSKERARPPTRRHRGPQARLLLARWGERLLQQAQKAL